MSTKSFNRKLRALGLAAALGITSLIGFAGTAQADPTGDPTSSSSATATPIPGYPEVDYAAHTPYGFVVHKHVEKEGSNPGDPKGDGLDGVEFTAIEIGKGDAASCTPLDLTTPAGWWDAKAAIEYFEADATKGKLKSGFCEITSTKTVKTTATVNGKKGIAEFTGVNGLWLVKETGSGDHLIKKAAAPYLVTVPFPKHTKTENSWTYLVDTYPKNELNTVQNGKTVDLETKSGKFTPGAEIGWTIETTLPKSPLPYRSIVVTEDPEPGLTLKSFDSVTIKGSPDQVLSAGADKDYTVSGANLTFTKDGLAKINALVSGAAGVTTKFEVRVTTTVNENINPGIYKNKATITVNGNPGDTPEPETLWGQLKITKIEKDKPSTKLAGAHFVVYLPTNGTCQAYVDGTSTKVADGITNDEGVYTHKLWIGNRQSGSKERVFKDYCFQETQAPDGYVLDKSVHSFTLASDSKSDPQGSVDYTYATTVENVPPKGPDIPLTGAAGAFGLTAGGLAVVAFGLFGGYLARRWTKHVD